MFWQTLSRPLIGLAPMNGITDHPFRHIQKKYGRPALLYTEFVGVERVAVGDRALLGDLRYDESQRPIIAQIYGKTPELFRRMAVLVCQLGFDGIDINMGCPAPSVVHRGSGAGLIQRPALAQEIVQATKAGVADWLNGATLRDDRGAPAKLVAQVEARQQQLSAARQERRALPVSVKTRIGYAAPQVSEWIPRLLESAPAALAIHGRTLQQGYAGHANWDEIARAAELAHAANVPVLGNGDVRSLGDALQRCSTWGLDGALIGRASYGNPFVFLSKPPAKAQSNDKYALLQIALEHARLYDVHIRQQDSRHFVPMRKHLSWYVRSVPGAAGLRRELVQTSTLDDVEAILERYFVYRRGWGELS